MRIGMNRGIITGPGLATIAGLLNRVLTRASRIAGEVDVIHIIRIDLDVNVVKTLSTAKTIRAGQNSSCTHGRIECGGPGNAAIHRSSDTSGLARWTR